MHGIIEADREAAKALREVLADVSGFWHRPDDEGQLCQALARHRIEAEQRLAGKLAPFSMPPVSDQKPRLTQQVILPLSRGYGPVNRSTKS